MGTIAEKLDYLEGTKSAIKDAIVAKGVEVLDTDTFRSYAEKIEGITTGSPSQDKSITITDNGTTTVTPDEGYLLNTVEITTNVPQVAEGKISLAETGASLAYGNITKYVDGTNELTDYFILDRADWIYFFSNFELERRVNAQYVLNFDAQNKYCISMFERTSNSVSQHTGQLLTLNLSNVGKNMSRMFQNVGYNFVINGILAPQYADYMFDGASGLKSFPNIDFSNTTGCAHMFSESFSEADNIIIPDLYIPNVTSISFMFEDCQAAQIGNLNLPMCNNLTSVFADLKYATSIGEITLATTTAQTLSNPFGYTYSTSYYLPNITHFGGGNFNNNINFKNLPNLDAQSIQNVIDKLVDLTGSASKTITFNSAVYNRLTEAQKTQLTAKNWSFASA